ncbi:MAG: DsbC family protein [Pseudomonadota bacterium]
MPQASSHPRRPIWHRRLPAALALAAVLSNPIAVPALADPPARPGSPLASGIDAMVKIPGGSWQAVRAGGETYWMSGNGRWVVKGQAYDLWAGTPLHDFADIRTAVETVKLGGFDGLMADLEPMRFGSGAIEVAVFVDPACPHCHELLGRLARIEDQVSVAVLQIPAFGEASGRQVRAMHCAEDPDAAREALFGQRPALSLVQRPDCAIEALHRRLVTAQMIGLRGVPFMVRLDSGRFVEGVPRDLTAWLEDAS